MNLAKGTKERVLNLLREDKIMEAVQCVVIREGISPHNAKKIVYILISEI